MGASVLVRGGTRNLAVNLGATAAAYTTGKVIGVPTKISDAFLDRGGTGVLESLCLIDKESKSVAVDLYFFQQKPTSQGADTGTFALSAAESVYLLGKVGVASADYSASSVVSEATKNGLGISLAGMTGTQQGVVGQGSRDLWVVAVARGSATWSGASGLYLRIGVLQD